MITPDIHESYSSDVAGSTVSDVPMLSKFEAEEKMFRNNDEEEEDENKPPAHDGPPKSPSREFATIPTAINILAEPVNHDCHRLHLWFHPIGNHSSPVGGSSNIHPNNMSAESPTYNQFKLPSLVLSSH